MAKKDFDPDIGKNTQFSSTNQPANRGRKKKIYTILKESGYSLDDIRAAMLELVFLNRNDLMELSLNPESPMILRIIGSTLNESLSKSDYSKIRDIIDQVIGKPKMHVDNTSSDGSMMPPLPVIEYVRGNPTDDDAEEDG